MFYTSLVTTSQSQNDTRIDGKVRESVDDVAEELLYISISDLDSICDVLKKLFLTRLVPLVLSSFCSFQHVYPVLRSTEKVLLEIYYDSQT